LKLLLIALIILLLPFPTAVRAQPPGISAVDRLRLAEAFGLGDALSEQIWRGWLNAPFAVLLVTPEHEFLVRHPKPPGGFTSLGYDSLLKSDVCYRKRSFPTNFLATFPAVDAVPTIVVGQAENTAVKTSTPWIVTLLHEHFHQLQMSQPTYNADVDGLNLSRGDKTGMWMLNFPFTYDSARVKDGFSTLAKSLWDAIQATETDFRPKLAAYRNARRQFQEMLSADDYRYFSFQLWQEGIARYTEYHIARLAAAEYKATQEFRSLKDFTAFDAVAESLLKGILGELSSLPLGDYRRVAFYPLGAGEGLLLDRANPEWRNRYFADKFYLDRYFN